MTSEVLNIGKLMRSEAVNRNTKKMKRQNKTYMISKSAINEMISYLEALIDKKVGIAVELANKENRLTIMDRDIINVNSRVEEQ